MKPVRTHWPISAASAVGWLTKNGSTHARRAAVAHAARNSTSRPIRQRRTSARETVAAALVANAHLVLEILPDHLVEPAELGVEAHFRHRARTRQRDRVDGLHLPRRRGHHEERID